MSEKSEPEKNLMTEMARLNTANSKLQQNPSGPRSAVHLFRPDRAAQAPLDKENA